MLVAGLLRFSEQNAFYPVLTCFRQSFIRYSDYCLKLQVKTSIKNSKENTNFGVYLVTLFKRPEHRTEIAKIDICSMYTTGV